MISLYGYSGFIFLWIFLWIVNLFGHNVVDFSRSMAINYRIARLLGSRDQWVDIYSFSFQMGLLSMPLWEMIRVTKLELGDPLLSFVMGGLFTVFVRVLVRITVGK